MVCCLLLDICSRTSSILTFKSTISNNHHQHRGGGPSQPPIKKNNFQQIGFKRKNLEPPSSSASSPITCYQGFSVVPLAAASVALILCSTPALANAGLLSGSTGIESVPGPELPQIEFLNRFNEENQKKYAENDARFKDSPVLKELLKRSKLNKEKNKQAILDKYCLRGAEWGVGDCSTDGMTPNERDTFIATLKKKAGVE